MSQPVKPQPVMSQAVQSQPALGNRPGLAAKLSLADLARVRQALQLLSDEPVAAEEPVPSSGTAGQQADAGASDPVAAAASSRAPFEPATESRPNERAEREPPKVPEPVAPLDSLSAGAAAKLDQIRDLMLMAEAIGEHSLDQHFDQVSRRQRELIREFFDEAAPVRDTPD